jgi:hypothetical protein
MTQDELKKRVDEIIEFSRDDERAHSEEDELHQLLIGEFCPDWVNVEIDRLNEASFNRWCA